MSPASRYQHNLKVLRRRDPSITSIFDQFSHVCVYHHNGTKWEKLGYEGSMFLYERETYPPYGFYILNRMGTDDHVQRLYPEDNIGAHGSYLIIRSYPEFTDRRLANVRATHNDAALDKFHDAYAVPNVESLSASQKGESKTIGLWMFATDSREPLIDTFTRLHSYIKRNQPYPQEFRYGPDRPPPTSLANRSQANGVSSLPATPSAISFPGSAQGQTLQPTGLSELDKLFAKMQPTPLLSAATSAQTASTSALSLLTALGGGDLSQSVTIPSPPSSGTINTGLSLLDSIFASASVSTIGPSSSITSVSTITASTSTITSTSKVPIHNPIPTTTPTPQVLDQSTLSTLLGHPPSRTASAASTAYSTDARSSHSSSREGDNEDEDTSDFYGYGQSTSDGGYGQGRRINGDVTPRPPVNGFITPPGDHVPASASATHGKVPLGTERPLVPFESDSELWPYSHSRATTTTNNRNSNNTMSNTNATITTYRNRGSSPSDDGDDDEILELDFEDTSALSDPDAFCSHYRSGANENGNGGRTGHAGVGVAAEKEKEKEKEKKGRVRKQSRKERAAEQAREREEIERSWDVPAVVPTLRAGGRVYEYAEQPESPSPCPSPDLHPHHHPHNYHYQQQQNMPNGNGRNGVASSSKQNVYPPLAKGQLVVPEAVRDGVLDAAAMVGKMRKTPVLERNDFVREVLMLIHVYLLFVGDTVHTLFTLLYVYDTLIYHFGDVNYLKTADWVFATSPALTLTLFQGILGGLVQAFFAWRVKILTASKIITISILLCAASSFLMGIATAVVVGIVPQFDEFRTPKLQVTVILWLGCSSLANILITGTLVFYLVILNMKTMSFLQHLIFDQKNHRTGFVRTNTYIDHLIRLTVQTVIFLSLISCNFLTPSRYLLFNTPLSKLYTNSLMSSLNARKFWWYDNKGDDALAIPSQNTIFELSRLENHSTVIVFPSTFFSNTDMSSLFIQQNTKASM
ncbi:mRNA-decapping enzyme 1B [Termitomyces sp. J132]|nr:mRNA-decapping enzyme 1B [Termitomyces sp. J132]